MSAIASPNKKTCLIHVSNLRLGMYIRDLRLKWWEHDFLRSSFLIDDIQLLNKLKALGDKHQVLIDEPPPEEAAKPDPRAVTKTHVAAESKGSVMQHGGSASVPPAKTDRATEMARAQMLVSEAKKAIYSAMEDGRTGQIKNLGQIQDIAQEMVASTARNAGALHTLAMLKSVDDYTFTHCVAVGTFMISLGRTLGLSEQELQQAGTAGLLHDVGKAGINESILNKPGKLTDEEFAHIRLHPEVGEQLLKDAGYQDSAILDVVRHHHERIDGYGYPDKLSGDALSLLARMGAVTDVYDAVTSNRCYHRAMPPTAALQMLSKNGGAQFDSKVVHAFIRTIGLYPNGSLVRLKSEKLAVVIEQAESDLTRPKVKVFFSIKSGLPIVPVELDLMNSKDAIASYESAQAWNMTDERLMGLLGLEP